MCQLNTKTCTKEEGFAFLAAATVKEVTGTTGRAPESIPLLPELRRDLYHEQCLRNQAHQIGCLLDSLQVRNVKGPIEIEDCHGLGYLVVRDINILGASMKTAGIQPMDIEAVRDDFIEAFLTGRDLYGVIVRAAAQAVQAMEER